MQRSLQFCRRRLTGITRANSPSLPFFSHNVRQTPVNRAQEIDSSPEKALAHSISVSKSYGELDISNPRRLLKLYVQLSKPRLTTLVVLTATSGVALCPLPTTIPVLLSTAVGTALCSASAHALNQLQEAPFDAQMSRTRTRPLVSGTITPVHAAGYAAVTGVAGPMILWIMANPTAALLGAGNIALYAGLYTWLKRKSIVNTWVGAVVGAIPPLMGWAACGGNLSWPSDGFSAIFSSSLSPVDNPLAPLALFVLLFSWQFPHFNSLSHVLRGAYAQAGFHMLSVINPRQNALVALRHAIILVPTCSILFPLSGLTTWSFALTGLVPNAVCVRAAWRFWRKGGEKEARIVFQHSLWYLPVILGLMMIHKPGLEWSSWAESSTTSQDNEEPEAFPTR
jgi:heme o synthase